MTGASSADSHTFSLGSNTDPLACFQRNISGSVLASTLLAMSRAHKHKRARTSTQKHADSHRVHSLTHTLKDVHTDTQTHAQHAFYNFQADHPCADDIYVIVECRVSPACNFKYVVLPTYGPTCNVPGGGVEVTHIMSPYVLGHYLPNSASMFSLSLSSSSPSGVYVMLMSAADYNAMMNGAMPASAINSGIHTYTCECLSGA